MTDERSNWMIIDDALQGWTGHAGGAAGDVEAALAAAGRLVDNTPTEPEAADPAQYTQERAALRAQREAVGKRVGRDCDYEGCTRTVEDGALHRVNPRGRPGVFMCAEHFGEVNSWEQRVSDRGEKEDAAAGRLVTPEHDAQVLRDAAAALNTEGLALKPGVWGSNPADIQTMAFGNSVIEWLGDRADAIEKGAAS